MCPNRDKSPAPAVSKMMKRRMMKRKKRKRTKTQ